MKESIIRKMIREELLKEDFGSFKFSKHDHGKAYDETRKNQAISVLNGTNNDKFAFSPREAREILKDLGWTDQEIKDIER